MPPSLTENVDSRVEFFPSSPDLEDNNHRLRQSAQGATEGALRVVLFLVNPCRILCSGNRLDHETTAIGKEL